MTRTGSGAAQAGGGNPEDEARDPLTGLPGLVAARHKLDAWSAEAPAHGLLLTLSRLSAINLAYGSPTGDAAIAEAAARLTQFAAAEFDGPWFAARIGGGNFLLLARETLSRERWELLGEGLAEVIARPIPAATATLRLSPRIALLRGLPGEGAESLLDRLGQTMTSLERRAGRRLLWADGAVVRPGHSAARLEADLLQAIDRDEIEVLFQPQFSLPVSRLTGAEALARWNHPRLGRVGAGALFALAERADQIAPLSQHIARKALSLARDWPADLRLSLNVTSADLAAATYAETMLELVADCSFPAECLTLEVTEQALIGEIAQAQRTLGIIASAGIRIALDDFGAGFCNFRYLKLLPLDYLKLDRTMVEGIVTDPRDLAVLRAIIAMAHALDLAVIAEGIEDIAQQNLVAAEGCAFMQGFLRARPMKAADFLAFAASAPQ
jgi:EAL domain-containing protein (putative c-di-GMP-specific phosphodiesterase class I)/GGDEF domain-containing protein